VVSFFVRRLSDTGDAIFAVSGCLPGNNGRNRRMTLRAARPRRSRAHEGKASHPATLRVIESRPAAKLTQLKCSLN
jgi:hypothetical protein